MRPNSNNSIFFIVVPLVLIADLQVLGKRFKRQKDDELDENGPDQFLQPTEMDGPDENLHLIDYPCSFPLISVENFENGCHEHNTYHSPYLCDIQSVLMESERRNLDKVMLKHNFSTCFCTDRDHQCQRHNGSLSVMVALVQHAELMSKLAYEMSQPNGVQREHPEVVIKWQTKADANHHRSLPKPFCTFNGPQTLGNAVKFYARWIRQKWSEALDCDIDLLILIIRSASLTDKLSEKETIPVKEWIGLDYNNAKVNENDFDLLGNINHWNSHESLANRVDKLISNLKIIRHRRMLSRKSVKDKPAPLWAVLLLFGCAFGGLLLACVGNWVSSRGGIRNRNQHVSSGVDPSWKVKFSSSSGPKPAAAGGGGGGGRKGLFSR